MSKAPPNHVSAQEAARVLNLTDERIRQLLRDRTLKGEILIESDGSRRYWVDATDLNRLRAERQRPANVEDVENAQEVSRELALRAVTEIIAARLQMSTEQIVGAIAAQEQHVSSEITAQRDQVTAAIQAQREEVTAALDAIRERQFTLMASVDAGVEILAEQSRKLDARSQMEQQHQERVRRHEQELIAIARESIREARRPPMWLKASVITILVCVVIGVILIALIFFETLGRF